MSRLGAAARRGLEAVRGFVLESRRPPEAERARERRGGRRPPVVLATSIGGGGGAASAAAAVGVAAGGGERAALLVDLDPPPRRRGPTVLASDPARALEEWTAGWAAGLDAAARGHLCDLRVEPGADRDDPLAVVGELLAAEPPASAVLVHLPPSLWQAALDRHAAHAGLICAELPADRGLAALAVRELHARGVRARVAGRPLGRVAARRALAGVEPGGAASRRAARLARGLLGGELGQSLPLMLGAAAAVIAAALVLVAIGGAITARGRVQRAADLAALSGARSMRDDFPGLFAPVLRPDGSVNSAHLGKPEYLSRARAAAREAAARNGVPPSAVAVRFPDAESFAPVRVRAQVRAEVDPEALRRRDRRRADERSRVPLEASAVAEAAPPAGWSGLPATGSGGGYSGPLAYRQGEGMRPDVAAGFDRLSAAARRSGLSVVVNSGFRSDAEQARLFAANPDPTWVAPPGRSLHRCATELDLGPAAAYGWLARNGHRFGFAQRYSWEPWHYGFTRGPAPCSEAANSIGRSGGDGGSAAAGGLPGFVPDRFRAAVERAAARWNVSAALLSAQLLAESNFNPTAVSPAGASGIAQFMPGTAAAYGLGDPFDASAAIAAQAHLMSDLLRRFGSIPLALAAYNAGPGAVEACRCVPPYPETRAYVARILGLLDGAGALDAPALEVRLVA